MHSIRLRGPWQYELSTTDSAATRQKVSFPVDLSTLLPSGHSVHASLYRHFNQPTGISSEDGLWLCVAECDVDVEAILNGKALVKQPVSDQPQRWEITQRIENRNELCLKLELSPDVPLTIEVSLQIVGS